MATSGASAGIFPVSPSSFVKNPFYEFAIVTASAGALVATICQSA
jgi:hypothetical protein